MTRKQGAIVVGGLVLVALTFLMIFDTTKTTSDGELDSYRTTTEITVSAPGGSFANTVLADCTIRSRYGWNTGHTVSTTQQGPSPFAVLGDRSILVLSDLNLCPSGATGETFTFDPEVPSNQVVNNRIAARYAHARRYDNVDDAARVMLYLQPQLFRAGVDGLRVSAAKLVITERKPKMPLPDSFGDAFPWYKNTPRAAVGSEDYARLDHATRFSGFIVRLNQTTEQFRCNKFDRDAEGPILVEGDRWDTCPPWGGDNLGWLVAKPGADFSRIDYSYDDRSMDKIATHYRATWLQQRGAPGVPSDYPEEKYFFWRPKLCFDGQCFDTHAARRTNWSGFRLYYPKKNQIISVEWVH